MNFTPMSPGINQSLGSNRLHSFSYDKQSKYALNQYNIEKFNR
jgi:hypothetical protein